jgi:hypothetical protein
MAVRDELTTYKVAEMVLTSDMVVVRKNGDGSPCQVGRALLDSVVPELRWDHYYAAIPLLLLNVVLWLTRLPAHFAAPFRHG